MQKANFIKYVRVPPISFLNLDPDVYRMTVGGLEVVCVALMLSGMPRLSLLANEVLLVLMCGALYTHFSVGDGVAEMGGAFVALGLVLTRLFTTGPFQATKKLKV